MVSRALPPRARSVVRRALVRYRHVGLRPADALLVSYPKSGSSWLRFMLTELVTGHEADYGSMREILPPIGRHRRAPAPLPDGGRVVRSHEPLRPYYGRPGQPVIYLVRNARDVCVSYFNNRRRHGFAGDILVFVDAFLAGAVDGYGRWNEHVLSALDFQRRVEAPFLLVHYEELLADPVAWLARILGFLHIESDEDALHSAVASTTRDRMRAKEDATFLRRTGMDGPSSRPPVQGRFDELVPLDVRKRFDRVCATALAAAGYEMEPTPEAPAEEHG